MRSLTTLCLALLLATSGAMTGFAQQSLDKLERLLDEEATAEPAREPPRRSETDVRTAPQLPASSEPVPGYLGLYAIEVDNRLIVESVRPGSPAETAEFLPGDQIVRIGGAPLSTLDEMGQVMESLPAGSGISFLVKRHGRSIPLLAVLGQRPVEARRIAQPTPATLPESDSLNALAELEALLDEEPPADDRAVEERSETVVLKRVQLLEAELRMLNARISKIERALSGVAASDE
jgi:membrane-associated protease RseP (regulator of RpoE activity)